MAVTWLVQAIAHLLAFIIGLLPTTPTAPNIAAKVTAALGGASSYFGFVANWFPIGELATALAGMFVFLGAIHVFRLIAWVLALVHLGGDDA
jgi:hypothetical protein